jgi:hypothetical protein
MALEKKHLERKLGVKRSETTAQYYPDEAHLLILDSNMIIGDDNIRKSST